MLVLMNSACAKKSDSIIQVRKPEVLNLEEFKDATAKVVGEPITEVKQMVGSQIFLNTGELGRYLVKIEDIELYLNNEGFIRLGKLEGTVVWGNVDFTELVVDDTERAEKENWIKLESLKSFHTGLPGSNAILNVYNLKLQRILVNGYQILTLAEINGYDEFGDTAIKYGADDVVDCASYWEWRCLNTACSVCTQRQTLPNGKTKVVCTCPGVGFCNWVWLPNCMTINCSKTCVLSGFWDWCDC